MVLYYSASQKTKIFAEALSQVLSLPLTGLKTKLSGKKGIGFLAKSLWLTLSGKLYPVDNMPVSIDSQEIYLCAPVWGGYPASPARYFLQNADLKHKKVHLILTCASITSSEKYKKNALHLLDKIDCTPGMVYVFATGKTPPDAAIIMEQYRDILPGF